MYEEEEKAENKEQMLRNEEATLFARTVIHPLTGQSCSPDYCHAGGVGCRGARVPECLDARVPVCQGAKNCDIMKSLYYTVKGLPSSRIPKPVTITLKQSKSF